MLLMTLMDQNLILTMKNRKLRKL